jgi:NAD(P)-dependent dehydrogenase (short-subunit alcohol dehydrogenase family)
MQDLEGKVAVVTGGASGIGLAMARAFGSEGMNVVIADIEERALDAAGDQLREDGFSVRTHVCDVSDGDAVDDLASAVVESFGAVHVVCNNAGVSGGGLLQNLSTKDWEWVLGVNLWGVIHGVRAFLPRLLEQGEGHIVNTASVLGLFAGPFTGPYAVSKFGVVALSEALFQELAISGTDVGVSVLCPGWVSTNLHSADRNRPEALRNEPSDDDADPVANTMRDALKSVIEAGMLPTDVAAMVVAAVKEKQFYILTHEASVDAVRKRADAIATRSDPPFIMPQQ